MTANHLARQAFAFRGRFPDAKAELSSTRLVWVGTLQPTPASRVYTVRITVTKTRYPRVDVIDPVLETRPGESLPHVFPDGSLCLHLDHEWSTDMLVVDTIVPWTAEWLINYEVWKATGEWHGGGEWPPHRVPEPDQLDEPSGGLRPPRRPHCER